jgi:PAS domain S-box-containing protein
MAAATSQTEPRSRKPTPLPAHPDFFKLLLDNMQVGVIVSDHEGTIVYINETYARFLGIDAAAQIGKHATEVTANSRLHIVARTGVMEINHPHQFKDKGFLVHRVPIREKGRVIAVLGLVLFEDADTASKLAEKVTFLESKLALYERELESFYAARYTFDNIVGVSNLLSEVKREARKAAGNRLPVLITGESGTGKELFAQAIHYGGSRKTRPFVRVNCAAIPKDLFESELFGYEKGAYTGADPRGKPGKFELAHKGSIFLDEIGDLPLDLQPKLLRVLELKEFERVGGSRLIRSDFRLIAATNQNILKMVEEGRFRKDLYYRLSVIPIAVPPLRERREDIIPLAHHLLDRSMEGGTVRMAPDAQACVEAYDWPGNVRELMNVMERAVAFIEAETIRADDLPYYIRRNRKHPKPPAGATLKKTLARAERAAIEEALAAAGNNKSLAARKLGIHRTLLYRKMRKLGIR